MTCWVVTQGLSFMAALSGLVHRITFSNVRSCWVRRERRADRAQHGYYETGYLSG
jgi:hypothetical protein